VGKKEKDKRIQSPPQQKHSCDEIVLANKSTGQAVSRNLGTISKILPHGGDSVDASGCFNSKNLPLFAKKQLLHLNIHKSP
jgi:hypothetical protein